jgi:hypothetical protein
MLYCARVCSDMHRYVWTSVHVRICMRDCWAWPCVAVAGQCRYSVSSSIDMTVIVLLHVHVLACPALCSVMNTQQSCIPSISVHILHVVSERFLVYSVVEYLITFSSCQLWYCTATQYGLHSSCASQCYSQLALYSLTTHCVLPLESVYNYKHAASV